MPDPKLFKRDLLKLAGAGVASIILANYMKGLTHVPQPVSLSPTPGTVDSSKQMKPELDEIPKMIVGATMPRVSRDTGDGVNLSFIKDGNLEITHFDYKGVGISTATIELQTTDVVKDVAWSPNNPNIAYSTESKIFAINPERGILSVKDKIASPISYGAEGLAYSDGNKIKVWQPDTNEVKTYVDGISSIWSSQGDKMAVTTADGSIKIYNSKFSSLIKSIPGAEFLNWRGSGLIAVNQNEQMKIIDVNDATSDDFELPIDLGGIIAEKVDFFIRELMTIVSTDQKLYIVNYIHNIIQPIELQPQSPNFQINYQNSDIKIFSAVWLGQTGFFTVETDEGIRIIQLMNFSDDVPSPEESPDLENG